MFIFRHKWLLLFFLFTGLVVFGGLEFFGIIWHNSWFAARYRVQGLDVSHHQGEIDWQKVAASRRYSFVYIKATEGHDFIDGSFADNWRQARAQGLRVGAYHFFSVRSSGQEQAERFIATVPQDNTALPPVIDLEIDLKKNKTQIRKELKEFAARVETQYQKRPIFYVTYDTYAAYIEGDFTDYRIWIRDILKPPVFFKRDWAIWQYSNRGRVDGIKTYVDINALNGQLNDL